MMLVACGWWLVEGSPEKKQYVGTYLFAAWGGEEDCWRDWQRRWAANALVQARDSLWLACGRVPREEAQANSYL